LIGDLCLLDQFLHSALCEKWHQRRRIILLTRLILDNAGDLVPVDLLIANLGDHA
jgi:hypothetical protein